MVSDRRRAIGTAGERAAVVWLQARGYRIVAQNARTRYGEIDVVARYGPAWVFVEVKSRSSQRFGYPLEAVDIRKRLRVARLAAAFLHARGITPAETRFDAMAVHFGPNGDVDLIEHVPDAFGVSG
jgi:putative endonuclease